MESEIYDKVYELQNKMPKFSKKEMMLLMSIIEDYKDIIENRKTDGTTTEKKNNAWKAVAQQYGISAMRNGITIRRTDAQLKRCWINLKYRCRKADSARKQYQLQTGGGPPAEVNKDEEINESVRSIVPTIDFTLKNSWDSTAELENIAHSGDEEFFDNSCEKENMEIYEICEDDEYCKDFGENNDQVPTSSASTDSSANNVQPKKRFSISGVTNTTKKMLTDTNVWTKKPLSKFNMSAMSSNVSEKNKRDSFNKISKIPSGVEIEQDIRLQKLEEATQQQAELHEKKLHAITMEKEYWEEMKKTVALKRNVYMLEIKAMKAQVEYWEDKQN